MSAYKGKVATDKWFPVRLVDSVDLHTAETGIAAGALTVGYSLEAGTSETAYAVTAGEWKEPGGGNYWLKMGAGEFAAVGKYIVRVQATGCYDYSFVVEAETLDDETFKRRVHGLAGGNKSTQTTNSITIRNEGDTANLGTLTRTETDTTQTVTPVWV